MHSRKYEKATNSSSSFWKKSSLSAVPGRPNPSPTLVQHSLSSPSPPTSTSVQMPTSFVAFDASVSDAWSAAQDGGDLGQGSLTAVAATHAANRAAAAVNGAEARQQQSPVTARRPDEGGGKPFSPSHSSSSPQVVTMTTTTTQDAKAEKLERYLASENVEMEALRKLSWSGLVPRARPKAWKILCGYLPAVSSRQQEVMARKQEEYGQYVAQYFQTKDQDVHQDTFRQIHIDIPRMSPVIALFQQQCVQEMFERILYIWAIRHPASGYVQGINDLVTPFFLVFLQDHLGPEVLESTRLSEVDVATALSERQLSEVEADSFWCLTKVLDGIQDNYTFAQPGIQLKVRQLEELVRRIDAELHAHLSGHEVLFLQFAFRWMNNILMRELPIGATIRLWDTYLSEIEGFSRFHLYVCAAFLLRWKAELMKKADFHTLLMFLQNLPTAKWGDLEIDLLVAEAWKLSYLFADAPRHLAHVQQKGQQ